ncbi:MAG: hypothetical protein NC113_05055 [Bacteroides sp.]|nr:hypothetical protein [Bacteroides sp.]MCM1447577.1 hypothetical protein [Bacteroides sp.]
MDVNQRISNHLILKSLELRDISLYHGKMGLVLAQYLYARQSGQGHVSDFAWDLLQEVYEVVNETLPIGLEYGLSGIGYGVSLLRKYGILDCDLDDVLCSIDRKIMSYDPRRMEDFSYRNGIWGVYCYIRLRMETEGRVNSFDSQYLQELQQALVLMPAFRKGIPYRAIWEDLQAPEWKFPEFHDKPIGIDGGLAYFLVSNLNLD